MWILSKNNHFYSMVLNEIVVSDDNPASYCFGVFTTNRSFAFTRIPLCVADIPILLFAPTVHPVVRTLVLGETNQSVPL